MRDQDRRAVDERKRLIETRARSLAEAAEASDARWIRRLGRMPDEPAERDRWLEAAGTVAAYRDRYGVTSDLPVDAGASSDAQNIERLVALRAVREAAAIAAPTRMPSTITPAPAVPTL
jgi:hypothetical protein